MVGSVKHGDPLKRTVRSHPAMALGGAAAAGAIGGIKLASLVRKPRKHAPPSEPSAEAGMGMNGCTASSSNGAATGNGTATGTGATASDGAAHALHGAGA